MYLIINYVLDYYPNLSVYTEKQQTDQALKPDLSIGDSQIPGCRAGKRGAPAVIG